MRKIVTYTIVFAFLMRPVGALASVMISEIMWMGSDISTSDEWLELAADDHHDLSGWTVSSVKDGLEQVIATLPGGSHIEPFVPIVLSRWAADRSRLSAVPFLVFPDLTLPNTKLQLRLRDSAGNLIDEADDGIGNPMAGLNPSGGAKAAMERIGFGFAGSDTYSWRSATGSLGFDAGTAIFGTPGFLPFAFVPPPPPPPPVAPPPPSVQVQDVTGLSAASFSGTLVAHWNADGVGTDADTILVSISPLAGSAPWILAATQTGLIVSNLNVASGSVLTVHVRDANGNQSHGVSAGLVMDPDLRISAFYAGNASGSGAWIEIVNLGGETVNTEGFSLRLDDEQVAIAGTNIEPDGYLALDLPSGAISRNRVALEFGAVLIDELIVSEMPTGVSQGRQSGNVATTPLCTVTPGTANDQPPLAGSLSVISGNPPFIVGTPLEVRFDVASGSMAEAECGWNFDGHTSTGSCMPAPYVLNRTGSISVQFEAVNYCGTTVKQELGITVVAAAGASSSAVSSIAPPVSVSGGGGGMSAAQVTVSTGIRLVGALPNPVGTDTGNEWVELINGSASDVTLKDWSLMSGKTTYKLDTISIAAGKRYRLMLQGTKLTLGNTTGAIQLRNPAGIVVSHAEWVDAREGRVYLPTVFESKAAQGTVTRVIDGDTFEVRIAEPSVSEPQPVTVRLLGVDAPELKESTRDYLWALESKKLIGALIENKNIDLQFDTEERDAYGRFLAYASVQGTSIQEYLLKNGLAIVYTNASYREKAKYQEYQKQAQAQKFGMWSGIAPTATASSSKTSSSSSSSGSKIGKNEENTSNEEILEIRAKVIISEIKSSNLNTKSAQEYQTFEWVELQNLDEVSQDLNGWKLVETQSNRKYTIKDLEIGSGAYLVLSLSGSSFHLRDSGGALELQAPEGTVVSKVEYPKLTGAQSYAASSFEEFEEALVTKYCITTAQTYESPNVCIQVPVIASKASTKTTSAKKVTATAKKTTTAAAKKAPAKAVLAFSDPTAEGSVTFADQAPMSAGGAGAMGMGAFLGSMISPMLSEALVRARRFLMGIA